MLYLMESECFNKSSINYRYDCKYNILIINKHIISGKVKVEDLQDQLK